MFDVVLGVPPLTRSGWYPAVVTTSSKFGGLTKVKSGDFSRLGVRSVAVIECIKGLHLDIAS